MPRRGNSAFLSPLVQSPLDPLPRTQRTPSSILLQTFWTPRQRGDVLRRLSLSGDPYLCSKTWTHKASELLIILHRSSWCKHCSACACPWSPRHLALWLCTSRPILLNLFSFSLWRHPKVFSQILSQTTAQGSTYLLCELGMLREQKIWDFSRLNDRSCYKISPGPPWSLRPARQILPRTKSSAKKRWDSGGPPLSKDYRFLSP